MTTGNNLGTNIYILTYASFRKSVLMFDPSDNSFTTGPELAYELRSGTCTIFNSPAHENRPVVFAGGRDVKVQLLDYTLGNTWEFSKYI